MVSIEELKELYNKDFPLWVEINLKLLKEKAYELVDWGNLLEEIEDMAKSDLRACVSYLAVILEHLYKWDHFKDLTHGRERGGVKWIKSVNNSRKSIHALFKTHPSLKVKLPEELKKAWIYAVQKIEDWLEENGYDPKEFNIPEECPYTYEEAMTRELKK
ncbi:MAG: DUF29 domain-containing protein [Aquificaceae bacterium]